MNAYKRTIQVTADKITFDQEEYEFLLDIILMSSMRDVDKFSKSKTKDYELVERIKKTAALYDKLNAAKSNT